jgi:hypothetical protein
VHWAPGIPHALDGRSGLKTRVRQRRENAKPYLLRLFDRSNQK